MDAKTFYDLQPTSDPARWQLPVVPTLCTTGGFLFGGCGLGACIAAMELVRYGVTVNCIAPAAFTRMTADLPGFAGADEAAQEALGPRWIANVAAWLASPEANNVTGRVFDVVGNRVGIAEQWH
ncbi:MAG: SDR family oxidoreductase, partial [Acidimicrobiales bacterium]